MLVQVQSRAPRIAGRAPVALVAQCVDEKATSAMLTGSSPLTGAVELDPFEERNAGDLKNDEADAIGIGFVTNNQVDLFGQTRPIHPSIVA